MTRWSPTQIRISPRAAPQLDEARWARGPGEFPDCFPKTPRSALAQLARVFAVEAA